MFQKHRENSLDAVRHLHCNKDIIKGKEAGSMGSEAERQDTRKAMAYDLIKILETKPEKESYTTEEIKKIIRVYLTTADQK